MRKISSFMLLAVIILSACTASYKKGKDDLEYKIIANGSGQKIPYGGYFQLQFSTFYNNGTKDSLMNDSRKQGGAIIQILDSVSTPVAYYEILKQLRKGDSVAIRILTDSVFKKNPAQMPPAFKKKHYLLTTLKIINIFSTKEQADSARDAGMIEMQKQDSINAIAQKVKDDKILQDYFKKNNIKATKTPLGAYVEIIQPGTGNNLDTSSIAKVNYTGRTLDGVEFDSNTDPAKGHVEPLIVNLTNEQNPDYGRFVIAGWKDGMSLLNKSAKAKFYIPSSLAYGSQGAGGAIGPDAILMFDIEILDVLTKEQAKAATAIENKKREEMQKHFMDSIKKLTPDTTNKK